MIMEGPLKGLIGFYLRHKGKSDKVVVSLELLRRSLAVEVEDWVVSCAIDPGGDDCGSGAAAD